MSNHKVVILEQYHQRHQKIKTLRIDKDASSIQITKAYRLKALKEHPDKNPNDPNATENFKQIQNAYDVLKDSQAKAKYDSNYKPSTPSSDDSANKDSKT